MDTLNNKKNYIANRRATQKAEDPEKYLRDQREYMKNYRKSKKIKKEPQINFTDTLVDKMELTSLNNGSPDINKSTLLTYGKNITRLHKMMYNTNLEDLLFLENVENVDTFIENKYDKTSTKLSYYKSINSFLKRIKKYEELAGKYAELQNNLKTIYDKQAGRNRLSERESKNFIKWDEILKYDTSNLDEEDLLLYTLLTAIPPRRLAYKYLKLIKGKTKEQIENLDKNFNYITVNKHNNPTSIVLNNYKTQKSYGRFTIDLTESDKKPIFIFSKIRKAIKKLIRVKKIKSGELVFPNNKGEVCKDFTGKIKSVFRNFEKDPSCNTLRHSFITCYAGKNLSVNTINLLSSYLGHSFHEFHLYRRN